MPQPGLSSTDPKLLIDWDGSGSFESDEDAFPDTVRPILATRGRSTLGLPYDPSIVGKLSTELRDLPKYQVDSSLRASVEAGHENLKVKLQVAGQDVWSGRLSSIVPRLSTTEGRVIGIEAEGPLGYLEKADIEGYESITNESIGARAERLVDNVPGVSITVDSELKGSAWNIGTWWPTSSLSVLSAVRELEEAAVGFMFELKGGDIRLASQAARQSAGAPVLDYTADDIIEFSVSDELDSVANIIRVPLYTFGTSVSQTIADETLDILLPASGEAVLEIDGPGEGVASWGAVTVTPGTVRGVLSEQDFRKAKLTLSGAGGTRVTRVRVQGQPVNVKRTLRVPVEDSTSKTRYGPKEYDGVANVFDDYNNALTYANRRLVLTKEPRTSPTFKVLPKASEVALIDLGKLITVRTLTNLNLTVFVERLHWEVGKAHATVTITGSLGNAFTSTLILNSVTRGVLGTFKLA